MTSDMVRKAQSQRVLWAYRKYRMAFEGHQEKCHSSRVYLEGVLEGISQEWDMAFWASGKIWMDMGSEGICLAGKMGVTAQFMLKEKRCSPKRK